MIAYVKGFLAEIENDSCIIDVGGIGYRVMTPITEELLRISQGEEITLYTYFCVREDAQLLYGFLRKEDLKLFKQLINVNGVGPKYAMAILAQMDTNTVVMAIAAGDYKPLTKVSGIGAKTAQRIVVDLKDKIAASNPAAASDKTKEFDWMSSASSQNTVVTAASDAVEALLQFGFSRKEAENAISRVYSPEKDASELVNEALTNL